MTDCANCIEMMPFHIDRALSNEETGLFNEHLESCESCRSILRGMAKIVKELNDLPQEDLPPGFHKGWAAKLPKPTKSSRKKTGTFNFGIAGLAAACVFCAFILLSAVTIGISGLLGRNGNASGTFGTDRNAFADAGPAMPAPAAPETVSAGSLNDEAEENAAEVSLMEPGGSIPSSYSDFRRTFTINLIVEDFQDAKRIIDGINGYNVSSHENFGGYYGEGYYSGNMTRRVDIGSYENAKASLRSLGEVVYENESLEKMSSVIQDLRVRITAKTEEEARLVELLKQSSSMAVMAAVESRLGWVTGELDNLKGDLRYYEDITARPYLEITVSAKEEEVPEVVRAGLGDKIGRASCRERV